MTDDFVSKVLYPDENKKSRIPLWLHWVGRISLILVNLAVVVWLWINLHYFFVFITGFLLIYQIVILFFGDKIRNAIIEEMSRI